MNEFFAGDRVTWVEGGRTWRGVVVRLGVIHSLVAPDGFATDWIATSKLAHESTLELICTDYEAQEQYGDYSGTEL